MSSHWFTVSLNMLWKATTNPARFSARRAGEESRRDMKTATRTYKVVNDLGKGYKVICTVFMPGVTGAVPFAQTVATSDNREAMDALAYRLAEYDPLGRFTPEQDERAVPVK